MARCSQFSRLLKTSSISSSSFTLLKDELFRFKTLEHFFEEGCVNVRIRRFRTLSKIYSFNLLEVEMKVPLPIGKWVASLGWG